MIKSAKDNDGKYFRVVNVETEETIKNVIWANDETGEYIQHEMVRGELMLDVDGKLIPTKKIGKIKLIDMRN